MTHAIAIGIESRRIAYGGRLSLVLGWAKENWDVFLILALVAAVFQPWRSTILPVTDFGEFLVVRNPADSVFSQFLAVARYYAAEGRFCLVAYMSLAIAMKAFGVWATGWYWMYFVVNCTMLLLARRFMLATGAARAPTFLVLALWATMSPTAEAWIRPTGEPFALIFFLIAMRAALNFGSASNWRNRAAVIALCAIGIVLSKEILVVLLPACWLVSRVTLEDGKWSWRNWSSRDMWLFIVVVAATLGALIPVVYVALGAASDKYASMYGQSSGVLSITIQRLELVLIPAKPRLHRLINLAIDPGWTLLLVLPNLLWIRLVVGGLASRSVKTVVWPCIVSAVWIMAGLAAYAPWPGNDAFYMMPFALGAMFGVAHVIGTMAAQSRSRVVAAMIAGSLILVVSSVEGRSVVYQRQLRARLYAATIDTITAHGGAETLVGATRKPGSGTRTWARNFGGFGQATRGMHLGNSRDLSCSAAKKALADTPGLTVISTQWGCGQLTPNSTEIVATVPAYRWPWLWERQEIQARMYIAHSPST